MRELGASIYILSVKGKADWEQHLLIKVGMGIGNLFVRVFFFAEFSGAIGFVRRGYG